MSDLGLIKRDYSPDIIKEETLNGPKWTCSNIDDFNFLKRGSMLAIALTTSSGCIVNANVVNKNIPKKSAKNKVSLIFNNPAKSLEFYEDVYAPFNNYLNTINAFSTGNFTNEEIVKRILSFKSLKENWDGYGSIPLEVESAANAISLTHLMDRNAFSSIYDFYPNPNGTITFLWKNDFSEKVQVEVGNETMSYYVEHLGQEVEFINDKKINHYEVQKLVGKIKSI